MTADKLIYFKNNLIQHGQLNNRIYLIKLDPTETESVLDWIDQTEAKENYGKVFAKIPAEQWLSFLKRGYRIEAVIPGMYRGESDGFLVCRYRDKQRMEINQQIFDDFFQACFGDSNQQHKSITIPMLPENYKYQLMKEEHLSQMADLYSLTFPTYPFPIGDTGYLKQTMEDNVIYHGIMHKDKLVALSSSETDPDQLNTEMTDFAVHPDHRGRSLGLILLNLMDQDMASRGYQTAYTIARLPEIAINRVFQKAGYLYSGTLVNNTQIGGGLESMNIWYRRLN